MHRPPILALAKKGRSKLNITGIEKAISL